MVLRDGKTGYSPVMPINDPTFITDFKRWQRPFELVFWPTIFSIYGLTNSITAAMDVERQALAFDSWEPVVWETSSVLASLLLVPAVVWFSRRVPLYWGNWRHALVWHAVASMVFSLAHVLGMVILRHGAYAVAGETYDFGVWANELFYEYLKDARTYAALVLAIEGYRFIVRRLQGEARWLDPPLEDMPEVAERPKRFLVKMLGREFLVAVGDIEWAQAAGNYVTLRVRGRDFPLRSTLSGLLMQLDPNRFCRVHRSYLVNLDHISEIEPQDSGDARIHTSSGAILPCSRRFRSDLRSAIGSGPFPL